MGSYKNSNCVEVNLLIKNPNVNAKTGNFPKILRQNRSNFFRIENHSKLDYGISIEYF